MTVIHLLAAFGVLGLLSTLLLLSIVIADCVRCYRDRRTRNAALRNVEAFRDIRRLHVIRADGDEILRVVTDRDAA